MKNPKIVKVVGSLVVVGGILVGSFVCSQKIKNQHNVSIDGTTQGATDSATEIVTDENGNVIIEGILGTETGGETEKDFIYDPMDFSKLEEEITGTGTTTESGTAETLPETESPSVSAYGKLLKDREFYYNHLVEIAQTSDSQEEDIAVAIYSVVRLDNDLANLLVKMYKEKIKEIENMKYYADQIETLEDVLFKMKDLESKVKEAEDLYQGCFSKLKRADKEQIQRAKKYTLTPLKEPMKELEEQIEDLKVLLEEALQAQTQD